MQADLRLCWSHMPHCWKSHAVAQLLLYDSDKLSCYRILTGMKIKNESDAFNAMQVLHDRGPKTVVLSSSDLGKDGVLVGLASTIKG